MIPKEREGNNMDTWDSFRPLVWGLLLNDFVGKKDKRHRWYRFRPLVWGLLLNGNVKRTENEIDSIRFSSPGLGTSFKFAHEVA